MAYYLNTVTGEYPRHDGDLELLGWKIGEEILEGWVEVHYVDPPVVEKDYTVEEKIPSKIGDKWYMSWDIRKITEEEKISFEEEIKRLEKIWQTDLPN